MPLVEVRCGELWAFTWRRQSPIAQSTLDTGGTSKTIVLFFCRRSGQKHAENGYILIILSGTAYAIGTNRFRGQMKPRLHLWW